MAPLSIIERIREEIIDAGLDDRYKPGAYEFVLNGMEFHYSKLGERRHVSGRELAVGLLIFAHKQYGLMAQSVFDHWGVKSTGDLGCIVYNMIQVGIMDRQPGDSLDDFYNVVDIEAFFKGAAAECFVIDKVYVKKK